MPYFGKASKTRRETLHPKLQELLDEAIKFFDFTIVCGYRDETAQNKAFAEKKSTKQYPKSKHNKLPSRAVDVAPYPIDWENKYRFIFLAGIIKGIAHAKGVKIRWGGDFNSNTFISDERFIDMPHIELVD